MNSATTNSRNVIVNAFMRHNSDLLKSWSDTIFLDYRQQQQQVNDDIIQKLQNIVALLA